MTPFLKKKKLEISITVDHQNPDTSVGSQREV